MATRKVETFPPVTMGHIRSHGCRDLLVYCDSGRCHHSALYDPIQFSNIGGNLLNVLIGALKSHRACCKYSGITSSNFITKPPLTPLDLLPAWERPPDAANELARIVVQTSPDISHLISASGRRISESCFARTTSCRFEERPDADRV